VIKTTIADVPGAIAKHQRWLDRQSQQATAAAAVRLKPDTGKLPMAKAQLRSEPRG